MGKPWQLLAEAAETGERVSYRSIVSLSCCINSEWQTENSGTPSSCAQLCGGMEVVFFNTDSSWQCWKNEVVYSKPTIVLFLFHIHGTHWVTCTFITAVVKCKTSGKLGLGERKQNYYVTHDVVLRMFIVNYVQWTLCKAIWCSVIHLFMKQLNLWSLARLKVYLFTSRKSSEHTDNSLYGILSNLSLTWSSCLDNCSFVTLVFKVLLLTHNMCWNHHISYILLSSHRLLSFHWWIARSLSATSCWLVKQHYTVCRNEDHAVLPLVKTYSQRLVSLFIKLNTIDRTSRDVAN